MSSSQWLPLPLIQILINCGFPLPGTVNHATLGKSSEILMVPIALRSENDIYTIRQTMVVREVEKELEKYWTARTRGPSLPGSVVEEQPQAEPK